MLKKIKLTPKLIGIFIMAGILPLIILGVTSNIIVRKALTEQAFNQLRAIQSGKKSQMLKMFKGNLNDINEMLNNKYNN